MVLPLRVRVDLVEMAMKEYSSDSSFPELESHHKSWFSVLPRISYSFMESLTLAEGTAIIF